MPRCKKLCRESARTAPIPRFADPVQIHLPHLEVLLAGRDDGVLHVQLLGETLDRAPARIGMLDVGLLVQLEEFEIAVGEFEQSSPPLALETEPAVLFHDTAAVSAALPAFAPALC